jgi:antitoxin VapB
MALNIKNPQVERLVSEIAAATGESKTEVVRRALEERQARLRLQIADRSRARRIARLLSDEVWPLVPADEVGRRLSREEEDAILGLPPESP